MATVTFANQSNSSIIGYISQPGGGGTPTQTPTINPGDPGSLTESGGAWVLTVQYSDSPPLRDGSPQVNIIARTNIDARDNDIFTAKFTKDQQLVASRA